MASESGDSGSVPRELSVTFGGERDNARAAMKRLLREALADGEGSSQERVMAAMHSSRMRKQARVWCSGTPGCSAADASWACLAWLQHDEGVGVGVNRLSHGPGSRALAFWQPIALFRSEWGCHVMGKYTAADIETMDRAGRVHG